MTAQLVLASVTSSLTDFVARHGAYAVFVLMAIDAVFPAGGELTMLFAGALASGAIAGHHAVLFGHTLQDGLVAYLVLWERKLASGIIGNPITYKVKGKQYVSILCGIGGWIGVPVTAGLDLNDKFGAIGATAMTKAANLDKIPQAGTLFTFRVMD